MIGRNILLKASTIENQSLVFVLRLKNYTGPIWNTFNLFWGIWKGTINIIWRKSFVVCWQVYLICFDIWLNVCCVHWKDAYDWEVFVLYVLYFKGNMIDYSVILIHKTAHWASINHFYWRQLYEYWFWFFLTEISSQF